MARILIVDDASFMRASLKHIIEYSGHQVVGSAANGTEAIQLYEKLKPELVTMDILMPGDGSDGLETAKAIRKKYPEAKVIMITALGQESKQRQAEQIGVSGYIRKPFKEEEVTAEIDKALNLKPLRRENSDVLGPGASR